MPHFSIEYSSNLENKVEEQSDKLDQITSLLNEISKKTSAS